MDELKPMEQRNEPTTAEIVAEFKRIASDGWCVCVECDLQSLLRQSIDRIEQLERENAANAGTAAISLANALELSEAKQTIADLTARAEKAEANVEDAHQRGYEEGMDEARHQYEEDGYV